MASAPTLDILLLDALEAGAGSLLSHGSGVQRSDVVRQIGRRLVKQAWPSSEQPPPHHAQALTGTEAMMARSVVSQITARLVGAAHACAQVVPLVLERLASHDLVRTPAQVGSHVAGAVCSQLIADDQVPSAGAITELAEAVSTTIRAAEAAYVRATRGGRVPVSEIPDRFSELDDQCWERLGRNAVRTNPPTAILLGPLSRPALVHQGRRRSWRAGSGLSINERYELRWLAADAQVECKHVPLVLVAPAADPFAQEVVRAAHPYGIRGNGNRDVLIGLANGSSRDDDWAANQRHRQIFDTLDHECRVLTGEPDALLLAEGLQGLINLWWWTEGAGRKVRRAFHLEELPTDLATRAIVRKAWRTVLAWDRTTSASPRTCQFVRAARIAVECGIPEELRARRDRRPDPDDLPDLGLIEEPPNAASASPGHGGTGRARTARAPEQAEMDLAEREARTLAALSLAGPLFEALRARDDNWPAAYDALLRTAGIAPEQALTEDELTDYLREIGMWT